MAAELSPTLSKSIFEGAGGSYATWSGADLPLLTDAKLGGGKLVLKPLGLALPHYSDSSKVGYVLEGAISQSTYPPRAFKTGVARTSITVFCRKSGGGANTVWRDQAEDTAA